MWWPGREGATADRHSIGARRMMIRGDWRQFPDDDDLPVIRPIYKLTLLVAVVFAVAWVIVSAALLVGLTLRFL
jgi:hypothetical protein